MSEEENARRALEADDEALAPFEKALQGAVEMVLAGSDPQKVLQQLLGNVPPAAKAALTRRFNFALEARKPKKIASAAENPTLQEVANHVAATPAPQAAPQRNLVQKIRFGLAQAALLMAAGTFDRIRAVMGKRPDLHNMVAQIGQRMNQSGVTADMVLLERLETIREQAMRRAAESQREQGR